MVQCIFSWIFHLEVVFISANCLLLPAAVAQDLIETIIASQFIPGWTNGPQPFMFWRGKPTVRASSFGFICWRASNIRVLQLRARCSH